MFNIAVCVVLFADYKGQIMESMVDDISISGIVCNRDKLLNPITV